MAQYSSNFQITPFQRLIRLLKPDSADIKNVYIYAIFNGAIALSLPLGIQAIINMIQGGQINAAWILLVVVVVSGIAAAGILQIFQLKITEILQQKIFTRAAFEFAYRIPKIRMEEIYKHYAPELMNRFFDTISVQKGLSKILIDFTSASLQVVFGLILLSFYHPFFIIFSLILILLIFAIFRFTVKKGLETSLEESKHKYKLAHWLEELARTSITFKLAGKTDLPMKKADKHVDNYLTARDEHFKILVHQYALLVGFKVLVATGLLAIGGVLVMDQMMNIGQFVAAEIIIILIMASVEKLVLSLETIYDVLTSLEKIGQVTDLALEEDHGINISEGDRDSGMKISINQLSFSYPQSKKNILNNLNLEVGAGEKVTIVGMNGSGKSTLLHIIAGLHEVEEGNVSYNDLPLGNIELSSLRGAIGDFLSEEQIFEGTLQENISLGREEATFERVKWAADNLELTEFVKNLPQGFNTILDPGGSKLSRSTSQKILLARSIAAKPRLLLFEDSFEHLDNLERQRIIQFLFSDKNRWTLLAVSNSPDIATLATKVIHMENGMVKMKGSFEEVQKSFNFNQ